MSTSVLSPYSANIGSDFFVQPSGWVMVYRTLVCLPPELVVVSWTSPKRAWGIHNPMRIWKLCCLKVRGSRLLVLLTENVRLFIRDVTQQQDSKPKRVISMQNWTPSREEICSMYGVSVGLCPRPGIQSTRQLWVGRLMLSLWSWKMACYSLILVLRQRLMLERLACLLSVSCTIWKVFLASTVWEEGNSYTIVNITPC